MFYEVFVGLCKEKGMSPTSVVQAIGLNKSNITYWHKGSAPSSKNLQKLADYFGVSVDYLLHGEESKKETPPADQAEEDDDLGDFSFALSGDVHELSPEEVASVKAFIRLLKQQKKPGNDNHGKDTGGTKQK